MLRPLPLQGCHMVPVLNALGVHCAAVGNHDVDWGIPKLEELIGDCHFPWLLANVLDRSAEEVPSQQGAVQHLGCVQSMLHTCRDGSLLALGLLDGGPLRIAHSLRAAVSSGEVARAASMHATVCRHRSSLAKAAARIGCGLLTCKPSCSELRLPARCLHAAMKADLRDEMISGPQAVWGTAGTRREAHAHAGVAGAEDWACRASGASETAVPVSSSAARLCLHSRNWCNSVSSRDTPLTL